MTVNLEIQLVDAARRRDAEVAAINGTVLFRQDGRRFASQHLVTDQAQTLARQLEASQAQEIDARLTELYLTMEQPALLNTLDLLRRYLIVFVLTGARAALLAVISFGWRMRRSRPTTRAVPPNSSACPC